jgi:hypothetical protein
MRDYLPSSINLAAHQREDFYSMGISRSELPLKPRETAKTLRVFNVVVIIKQVLLRIWGNIKTP